MLERDYTIPLRNTLAAPRTNRAPSALRLIRNYLTKHMKGAETVVGESINLAVWEHGAQNIPEKVRVHCMKDDKGIIYAELPGVPIVTREAKKKMEEEGTKKKEEKKEKGEEKKTEKAAGKEEGKEKEKEKK